MNGINLAAAVNSPLPFPRAQSTSHSHKLLLLVGQNLVPPSPLLLSKNRAALSARLRRECEVGQRRRRRTSGKKWVLEERKDRRSEKGGWFSCFTDGTLLRLRVFPIAPVAKQARGAHDRKKGRRIIFVIIEP